MGGDVLGWERPQWSREGWVGGRHPGRDVAAQIAKDLARLIFWVRGFSKKILLAEAGPGEQASGENVAHWRLRHSLHVGPEAISIGFRFLRIFLTRYFT